MLTVTFSAKKLKSAFLSVIMGVILGGVMLLFSGLGKINSVPVGSYAERTAFLETYGYVTDGEETAIPTVIPTKWNDVYEKYNALQISQGLDLGRHRGESVTRYIYRIENHPLGENVTATITADEEGNLIACDITCNEEGAFPEKLITGK